MAAAKAPPSACPRVASMDHYWATTMVDVKDNRLAEKKVVETVCNSVEMKVASKADSTACEMDGMKVAEMDAM